MSRSWIQAIGLATMCSVMNTEGCATVKVVPASKLHGLQVAAGSVPVAHVYADNWGIYLFKHIPLVTGNLNRTGGLRLPALFTNNVQVDHLVELVSHEAQHLGTTLLTDLTTHDRSYWMPWTLVFWLNEFEVSATASRPLMSDQPTLPDGRRE